MHPSWPERDGFRSRTALAALLFTTLAACAPSSEHASAPPSTIAPAEPAQNNAATCAPANVDATRYLRQLSLDLRGRPPTAEELARVDREGAVSDAMIDEMLDSPEFLDQVRTWHRALLWPNLNGFHISAIDLTAFDVDANGNRTGNTYSPDPELVENAARHPHAAVTFGGNGGGDRSRRGGAGFLGCDPLLDYPAPASSGAQPTYSVLGSDGTRRTYSYYDTDGVPLPYHDAAHCSNYCVSRTAVNVPASTDTLLPADVTANATHTLVSTDFHAMDTALASASSSQELDPHNCGAAHNAACGCADGFVRVVNPCDNHSYDGADRPFRIRREGSRSMPHYWAGNTPIRTCAYDAQDRTNSAYTGGACASPATRDATCGCGPQGLYCMPSTGVSSTTFAASRTQSRIRDALNDEPLYIVSSVVERNEDYYQIFLTRRSFITGPLAHLYKSQLASVTGLELGQPAPPDAIPDLAFTDTTWREYVRNPEHAGVLTTAAYLGRFPTWRSRVSQFRTSFMCRPFTPGAGSLPAPDDPCTREPNLARRCGCQNCHSAVEPMGAWFGRWAERSTRYLDPATFPSFDPNCQQCALTGAGCTTRCRTYYVTDPIDADGARYAGTLRGYLYRTPVEVQRIDEGPSGLVDSAVASGELQSCTVRTTWSRLLGRTMSESEMRVLLPDLVDGFNATQHNYRALVRAIVTSPVYRRVD